VLIAIFSASCQPPTKNDGRESGYYGDFNRVSNAIASIPGITVTNFWMNRDYTLEEFGFQLISDTGKPLHVGVGERSPLRTMSRLELVDALKKEIAQQLSKGEQ
jgi:hypothetical protein